MSFNHFHFPKLYVRVGHHIDGPSNKRERLELKDEQTAESIEVEVPRELFVRERYVNGERVYVRPDKVKVFL